MTYSEKVYDLSHITILIKSRFFAPRNQESNQVSNQVFNQVRNQAINQGNRFFKSTSSDRVIDERAIFLFRRQISSCCRLDFNLTFANRPTGYHLIRTKTVRIKKSMRLKRRWQQVRAFPRLLFYLASKSLLGASERSFLISCSISPRPFRDTKS